MTYTDFSEKLLIALYQEAEAGDADQRFEDVLAKYGLPQNLTWLTRLTDEWERNGLVELDTYLGSPLKWRAEIAGPGMRYIEQKYGSKNGVGQILAPIPTAPAGQAFLTIGGQRIVTKDGNYITVPASPEPPDSQPTISSSAWTGLPTDYELTAARRAALTKAINIAEGDLDALGASNAEKAQARAYIVAIRALSEAPDPPADLIWTLLNRAAAIATIASLFIPLIQAFVH